MDMTENERIWQFLESHKQEFLDYWQAQLKDASRVELVSYDPERMVGVLMSYNWQGVSKLVTVSPEELLDAITGLSEQLVEDCQQATEEAQDAAQYASGQGDYAKQQGNRVDAALEDLAELEETVRQQGNTAEAQGARAQSIYETVSAWYTAFKQDAESWLSGIQGTWNSWYSARQGEWSEWFNDKKSTWTSWYNSVSSAWSAWYSARQSEWSEWFSARQSNWNTLRGSIESATSNAQYYASQASYAARNAQSEAARASSSAATAARNADYAEEQGDRAKAYADNPGRWIEGEWWQYDEVSGELVNTHIAAFSLADFDESERQAMYDRILCPRVDGSTLVFPASSGVSVEGSTLIIPSI